MSEILIVIIVLVGLAVLFYSVQEFLQAKDYEEEVKRILRDNHCPLYNRETMLSFYDRKDPPFLAADAIMTMWEKTEPTFRHNRRSTDLKYGIPVSEYDKTGGDR